MNIQHLRYLIEIERCGSISRAAAGLYMTQPYLSKVVHELESQYNITLFTRGRQGITLTDSGRVFIEMSKGLLENVEQFNRIFQNEIHSNLQLRIATTPSSHVMDAYIRLLKELKDRGLRFQYKEASSFDVINDIYTNAADVGVIIVTDTNLQTVHNLLQLKRIASHKIFTLYTHLIVGDQHPLLSKKEPITLEDVYDYNFVMYASQAQDSLRSIENMYSEHSLSDLLDWSRIRQIVKVYSRSGLHNLLTQMNFIALGGKEAMQQAEQFHIRSLPFPLPTRYKELPEQGSSMYYIHLKDRKLSAAAVRFVEVMMTCYGE